MTFKIMVLRYPSAERPSEGLGNGKICDFFKVEAKNKEEAKRIARDMVSVDVLWAE